MHIATESAPHNATALKDKAIERCHSKVLQVGVIGLGYVGLPLALLFSEEGFAVTGFDIDTTKIDVLSASRSYIGRIPETEIALARNRGFQATADFACVGKMDCIIICVPTPLTEYHEPDLSFITDTVKSIAPHLKAGQLVVLESTTYPGTTEEVVLPLIEKGAGSGLSVSRGNPDADGVIFLAFSPEREDPGNNTVARSDIPKVIGGTDTYSSEIATALYGSIFHRTVVVSSTTVAEMTKLLENIYRCVNIALVNELKLLCLRMGIDIWEVIATAATKPFSPWPHSPSVSTSTLGSSRMTMA